MPTLNPEIFVWARETAGLNLHQASEAIELNDARGITGAERLASLEAGKEEPSRSLILRMARAYRRSLLVFYLDAPPKTGDRGQDFRTVPGAEPPEYSPLVDALIRDIRGRQSILRSLLEDLESDQLPFVGSTTMRTTAESLAGRIVKQIGFSLSDFRNRDTVDGAFSYLRSRIEETGIFVLLLGNLGSHHTNISVELFRGFAIADNIAPLVIINDQDARSAWSFTALHEVTHLWLGTTGISGWTTSSLIEQYCNAVAGEILLPRDENDELFQFRRKTFEQLVEQIGTFTQKRKISRAMVTYRLFQLGVIEESRYRQLVEYFRKEWLASKELRATEQARSENGPNYYVVKRHRLGKALLNLATHSLAEGLLTYTKASQLLGVKPRNVDTLLLGNTRARRDRA